MAAITTDSSMSVTFPYSSTNGEIVESIEWDLPSYDNFDGEFPDFGNLSLGTEMRNKLWENNNKITLGGMSTIHSVSLSPSLEHNVSLDSMQYLNGGGNKSHPKTTHQSLVNVADNEMFSGVKYMGTSNGNISPAGTGGPLNGLHTVKNHTNNQPLLLRSPIPVSNETPDLLPLQQESGYMEPQRMNENHTVKEQLEEMKAIVKRLATNVDDISLPQPVQLTLRLIELEYVIQERDAQLQNKEKELNKKNNEIEQTKRDKEFEFVALRKEIKFCKEKLEYKQTLDVNQKSKTTDENGNDENASQLEQLKEEFNTLTREMEKNQKEAEQTLSETEQKLKMAQFDVANFENELKCLRKAHDNEQLKDQKRKTEVQKFVAAVRDSMEKERRDQYHFICEHNQLKHKWDKLNENCKSYQMKNEELCRIQNELEKECDQFRTLKKIIQDHGLNHEHLVLLQQQKEMFKDDVLTERKDRERAQAQRDKLRRDLDILHSRNQSLQEQVYKYQEHIMRLNTGDRRQPQPPEFMHQHQQGNNRFSRQLSNPAYFNPRIRQIGPTNLVNPLIKAHNQVPPDANPPINNNRQSSPINDGIHMSNGGFPNSINGRTHSNLRSPQGFNSGFDAWQQQQQQSQQRNGFQQLQQQHPQQLNVQHQQPRNSNFATSPSQMPQSPLLGPNGDPWILPPTQKHGQIHQQQNQQLSPSMSNENGSGYSTNIWSQLHGQSSPTTFSAGTTSNGMRSNQSSSPSWQLNDTQTSSFAVTSSSGSMDSNGGGLWSTASDEHSSKGTNIKSHYSQNFSTNINDDYTNDQHGADNIHNNNKSNRRTSPSVDESSARLMCGKCNTKLPDTKTFRQHVEQCFN